MWPGEGRVWSHVYAQNMQKKKRMLHITQLMKSPPGYLQGFTNNPQEA